MVIDTNGFNPGEGPGLYLHVPFCQSKCRYCSFYSEPLARFEPAPVIAAMIAEMDQYDTTQVATLYIGGGSPSVLPCDLLLRLVGHAAARCPAALEFTVELNPGQTGAALFHDLRRAGVNRISLGAQSFIQFELDLLGRIHTPADVDRAVRQARDAGFENISLDLIFAIPGSTLDSWKCSLDAALALAVPHISAYSLTWEDGTLLSDDLAAGRVVQIDEETDRVMYELAIDAIAADGLKQYEISNFARPGYECRHNLNYWSNGDYLGLGPAAASCRKGVRTLNVADLAAYTRAVESARTPVAESEILTPLERACETAVLNLRRRQGIDLVQFKKQTGFDAMSLFASSIQIHREQGFILCEGGRVFLTQQALAIADSILCDFADV
jgi:oxygen-independent coproporphyrinogen III oxidase